MSCKACQDLCTHFSIYSVFDRSKAFRVAQENLADGTILLVSGELPPDDAAKAEIECALACSLCGHGFTLSAAAGVQGGGAWGHVPTPDSVRREIAARREARIARFPERGLVEAVTLATLRRRIEKAGLASRAEDILALARPCVQLEPWPCRASDLVERSSRIGGEPYLPEGFEWPEFNGTPLDFICQFDLRELPGGILPELPPSGLLSFFYATSDNPWGDEPGHMGSALVHYHDATDEVPLSMFASEAADDEVPGCHEVRFVPGLNLPDARDPVLERLAGGPLGEEEQARYFDMVQSLVLDHHLMGHPGMLQDHDMRLDCASNSRRGKARGSPSSWRLLLQLGGDSYPLGLPWDGTGRIYFWVTAKDLAARKFTCCWLTFQAD